MNYTPHAILAGSVVIAIGLYLGLRREPPPRESMSAPASTTTPPTSSDGGPSAAPQPSVAPLPSALPTPTPSLAPSARAQTTIDADVAHAIETLKQRVVRECWTPHVGEPGMPPKLKFVYSGSFDPSGVEVARGISEDRVAQSAKVAACLRGFKMDLAIPPPGAYQNVNVPFEVP